MRCRRAVAFERRQMSRRPKCCMAASAEGIACSPDSTAAHTITKKAGYSCTAFTACTTYEAFAASTTCIAFSAFTACGGAGPAALVSRQSVEQPFARPRAAPAGAAATAVYGNHDMFFKVLSLLTFFAPAKKVSRPRGRNPRLRCTRTRNACPTRIWPRKQSGKRQHQPPPRGRKARLVNHVNSTTTMNSSHDIALAAPKSLKSKAMRYR